MKSSLLNPRCKPNNINLTILIWVSDYMILVVFITKINTLNPPMSAS